MGFGTKSRALPVWELLSGVCRADAHPAAGLRGGAWRGQGWEHKTAARRRGRGRRGSFARQMALVPLGTRGAVNCNHRGWMPVAGVGGGVLPPAAASSSPPIPPLPPTGLSEGTDVKSRAHRPPGLCRETLLHLRVWSFAGPRHAWLRRFVAAVGTSGLQRLVARLRAAAKGVQGWGVPPYLIRGGAFIRRPRLPH